MSLSIKISKKAGERSDVIASRSWPQSRITIGRGEECTLVLEDPKKHVSRVHVELEEKDEGAFVLTVVSKVNPIFIGGKRQAPGSRLELSAGERFELGEYEIELLEPPKQGPKIESPVSEAEETTRPDNPMLQLKAQSTAAEEMPAPVPIEAKAEPPQPAPAAGPVVIDEDIFGGEIPPVEAGLFDEATYVGGSAAAAVPPAPAESIYDEATYVGGRPPAQPPAAAAGEPNVQRVLQAFLEGAGLAQHGIPDADAEEFLRQSGAIVRAAVEGVMTLLVARATAKKELRADERTMVASRDNNPLKLMSDPQEAMAFLFDPKERSGGFLNPVQAVGDAFEDLRAHEVALIAGMRAALLGAIQRFDPKALEAELEKKTGGLGLNRKAKLWELFAAYQEKLARDAGDDFNKVFGREFMGTYMAQVKRLRGGR